MEKVNTTKPPWTIPQWQRRKSSAEPSYIARPPAEPVLRSKERPYGSSDLSEQLTFKSWDAPQMEELQAAKHRISFLESTNRWELVKKMVNPYEMVYTHEDPHFHPSIAVIKPLSRSYFKLIEILSVLEFYENLPKQIPKIRTAHIAEGPGGFIQAIVDLTERNKKTLQLATAMTLKPTDQRVPGWRRASSFLQHHREVRLHYGADGTGDVYKVGNQDSFVRAIAPSVNLFTADGGFDFSINYDIQEQRVYHLLVCSATIGLRCLSTDGSFVLKLFDIFSESTIILIGLISRCFKEWTLYKPALSRPCNSERYFLGRGFTRLIPSVLTALNTIQTNSLVELYPTNSADVLTKDEIDYIQQHVTMTTTDQLRAISVAEQYATHPEAWYSTQLQHDFQTSLFWCQRFHIPFTMTKPMTVHPVVYTSAPIVFPRLQLPGGDLSAPLPFDQASQALSVECSDQTRIQLLSQKD